MKLKSPEVLGNESPALMLLRLVIYIYNPTRKPKLMRQLSPAHNVTTPKSQDKKLVDPYVTEFPTPSGLNFEEIYS